MIDRDDDTEFDRSSGSLATGEFVVMADHDDILTKDALERLAQLLKMRPDADFIYSDSTAVFSGCSTRRQVRSASANTGLPSDPQRIR